jgi:hypothetical protein
LPFSKFKNITTKYMGQTGCVVTYHLPILLLLSVPPAGDHPHHEETRQGSPDTEVGLGGPHEPGHGGCDGGRAQTIPYEQRSYSDVYAVSNLKCVYNGARDELRGIGEGLEEDLSEAVMTEVVKTEVLPAIFSKVDKVADMELETTNNLTETDLDCMQFCEDMPSQGSVSEAAVMVEESESGI